MLNYNKKNLLKAQEYMLFLMIIFLPLNHFHKLGNLAYYPLMIGLVLWLYEAVRSKEFDINNKFGYYFLLYVCWQILCTVIGIYTYRYYNLIDITQIDKLQNILTFFDKYGIQLNQQLCIKSWLFIRFEKSVMQNAVLIFGTTFWVWHMYVDDVEKGFRNIRKAVLVLTVIMSFYSVIEIAFLRGNNFARNLLLYLNPFLYDVSSVHAWWPPVLWEGQVRSICAEPSFFGILSTFIIPIIFSYILDRCGFKYFIIYTFYILLTFLTKARTATVLFISQMVLLVIGGSIYLRKYWRKIVLIFLCGCIAFSINIIGFGRNFEGLKFSNNNYIEQGINHYVQENVTSVVGNKRSNNARWANNFATIKVGLQHPIFGVGYGLKDAYVDSNLPEWSYNNIEVRNWSRYMHINGVLKSGFPTLTKFTGLFAEFGIIGILLYVLPIVYVLFKIFKQVSLYDNINLICILISFLGSLAAMFSNTEFLSFYILFGLLLCYIDEGKSEGKI